MRRSRRAANRTVLGLAGLALVTAAAAPAGVLRGLRAGARLCPGPVRELLTGHPTAAAAVCGCLGILLGAALLAAQLPGRTPRRLPLGAPRCSLDGRAVRLACTRIPGVARARCRLTGTRRRPELALTLRLHPDACPQEVLDAVGATVLPPVAALLTPQPGTHIRLHVRRPRSGRAV
ncbi:hypothetical protein ACIPW5_05470 [Streptomyces sp. NPDC090077]|uniref:hypothetical protein n=1 Tax=Streptomyces sp. NPDC090077 TaxID=3365938 RepID=UPI00382BF215